MNNYSFPIALLIRILLPLVLLPAIAGAETVTKRVDLEGIKHVHLIGTYNLSVTQGDEEYLALTTDSDMVEEIQAKVQGSKLVIGQDDDRWSWRFGDGDDEDWRYDASFVLQIRELRSISNLGVGQVEVNGINSDEDLVFSNLGTGRFILLSIAADDVEINNLGTGGFEVQSINTESITENSTGAGRVEYSNVHADEWEINSYGNARTIMTGESRTDKLEIDLKGAGEVDAEALITDKAEISISGAGSARVYVTDELDVTIEGVGKVYYRGAPEEIRQDLGALGELIAIDR